MAPPAIAVVSLSLLSLVTLMAEPAPTKLKVRVTHYGYPGDPHASANTRLGLGDHNNILNPDSVAVTPDMDRIFPFGSKVYVSGHFLGFRHDTLRRKLHYTIAVYDPDGKWKKDFGSYIDIATKK
jgi:hypothetical protein